MQTWVMEEMQGLDFGDKRRERRFLMVLSALSDKPSLSIPAACGGWAETMGAYRLFESPSVTMEAVLAPHREATIARVAEQSVVIVAQDTTTLNLTRPEQPIEGTGPLSDEHNHGLFDHLGLAVSTSGVPLGVAFAECWARDWETFRANQERTKSEKAMRRRQTPFGDKESARWRRGYERGCELARRCPETTIVVVSDSEADILDCFAYAQEQRADDKPSAEWITRAYEDRLLGETAKQAKLWETCQAAPVLTTMQIEVSDNTPQSGDKTKRNQARAARVTTAEVRVATVTVRGQPRVEGKLPAQTMNAIYVREPGPPAGEKPVEWLLLTSLSTSTIEEVLQVIHYYVLRWSIEIYFRILKVGCGVEELQFENRERYQRCLATYMIVTWRVFYAMMLGRQCPEISCESVFAPEEWKALYTIVHKKPAPPAPPRLGEAMAWVARLGGYLGRKGDGPPGPQTTWIGMQRVKDFALAWQAFGPESSTTSEPTTPPPRAKTARPRQVRSV